jgi:hypothetical protein
MNETAMPSSAVTATVNIVGSVKSNKGTIAFYSADNPRYNISSFIRWWDWFTLMIMMWWWRGTTVVIVVVTITSVVPSWIPIIILASITVEIVAIITTIVTVISITFVMTIMIMPFLYLVRI